jgi:tetratricopeptide (TPR) repeat protein
MTTDLSYRQTKANRYEILEKIGQGGMGIVYRVSDRLTDSIIALKQVTTATYHLEFSKTVADDEDTSKYSKIALANEFKILSSLRHPNIISVLDYGFDDEQLPFFTMDLLESPREITDAALGQPTEFCVQLLLQFLQALAYLHQHGIIHRDLKPSNVLVTSDDTVKVLDFGLALTSEYAKAIENSVSGTLPYMAPEVIQGQPPSVSSDLYAFGIIAYEVLSGKYPFTNTNINAMLNEIMTQVPDLTPFTPGLAAVLGRLTAKSAADRYPDVNSALQALSEAAGYERPVETAAIRESYLQTASFIGRSAELDALYNRMREAVSGNGSVCLVGGESGIGKSRLLHELRVRALVENVPVLRGQAIAEKGDVYRVWRDVLRWLSVLSEIDAFEAGVLKEIIPNLEELLGYSVPDIPELGTQAARERLTKVVVDVISRQQKPMVILLEDLQWASEDSITLLQRLSEDIGSLPILLLGSYRDDETPDLPTRIPQAEVIKLHRFNSAEIAEMSQSILGRAGTDNDVVSFLKRETEGNVFFVVETLRALADEAGELQKIGQKPLPEQITAEGVAAIIRQRLGRMPQEGWPLLNQAAVMGRELDINVLRQLAPDMDVNRWLLAGANVAVLEVEDGRWRFAHDKLREQLLRDLEQMPDVLRGIHQQVAEALETVYPGDVNVIANLAYHWTKADVPDKAVRYHELAAQRVWRSSSEQAIQHLTTAMSFDSRTGAPSPERNALRYSILGNSSYTMGRNQDAKAYFEKAFRYMSIPTAPDKDWQVGLGILGQVGLQALHRLMPARYLAQRDSTWFESSMFDAVTNLPIVYYGVGETVKVLYAVLVALNTLEAFRPSAVCTPLLGYTWIHYALSLLPLHRVSSYYRRLAMNILEDEKAARSIPLYHQVAAQAQMAAYALHVADWKLASDLFNEVIRQTQGFGDLHSLELGYYTLSLVDYWTGRYAEALDLLHAGYPSSKKRGDQELRLMMLGQQAIVLMRLNRLNPAELEDYDLLLNTEAAQPVFAGVFKNNRSNEALYHIIQAAVLAHQSRYAEAWTALGRGTAITFARSAERNPMFFALYDLPPLVSILLLTQGGAAFSASTQSDIRQALEKSLRQLKTISKVFVFSQPRLAYYQGWAAYLKNELPAARSAWEQAAARALALSMPPDAALAYAALANLNVLTPEQREGHLEEARRIFAALDMQFEAAALLQAH